MNASLKFIGKISSILKTGQECPLQESENATETEITIFPEYLEAMEDLAPGIRQS